MLTKNFYSFMRAALQNVAADFALTIGDTQQVSISSTRAPLSAVLLKKLHNEVK